MMIFFCLSLALTLTVTACGSLPGPYLVARSTFPLHSFSIPPFSSYHIDLLSSVLHWDPSVLSTSPRDPVRYSRILVFLCSCVLVFLCSCVLVFLLLSCHVSFDPSIHSSHSTPPAVYLPSQPDSVLVSPSCPPVILLSPFSHRQHARHARHDLP